jgi:hypothetical protein
MSQVEDKVQVAVHINTKPGISALGQLEMELNESTFALKKLKKNTEEYANVKTKIDSLTAAIKRKRNELGLQGMTLKQLRNLQRELNREMDTGVTRGTQRYKELNKELQKVNAKIASQRLEMRGLNTFWAQINSQVKQFGALALGYLGLTTFAQQLTNLTRKAGEFSDTLARVSKTTGLTKSEVEDLNKELKALDTRTARKELLGMAAIAGKLGITAKNDVLGFVSAADKINVALGEDLGNAEESMRKLGKLIETFKVKEIYGVEDALLKVGSAVNHLGKSSTANEGFIVEFARRMGGIAPLARISIQDILGLAAASDALGLSQEVTTTALNKLFLKMTSDREIFVQYARDINGNKLSLEQFSTLIETDFNEAFASLLRGVKDNSQGMTALSDTLGDLELDGGRIVQVLGTLANNTALISAQQKISNDEFAKGTSVLEEFSLMNDTLGAKLDKLGKAIFSYFVNSAFVSSLEHIVGLFAGLLPQTKTAIDRLKDVRTEMNLEIDALKNANLTQQMRLTVIDQINTKYKDYLPRLITEKDTLTDINALQQTANENLMAKIVIMEYEQEITAIQQERLQAEKAIYNIELQRQQLLKDAPGMDHAQYIKAQQELMDNMEQFQQFMIDDAPRKMQEARTKFESIAKRMGTDLATMMAQLRGRSVNPTQPVPPKVPKEDELSSYKQFIQSLKKLRADLDISLLDSEQQEVANIEAKYEDLYNQAHAYYADGIISHEEYTRDILFIDQQMEDELTQLFTDRNVAYAKSRQSLQTQIELELMSDQDRELATVAAHYDKLIEEAKKFNLDITALTQARADALDVVNDNWRNKDIEKNREHFQIITTTLADVFQSVSEMQSDQTKQGIESARNWANSSIITSNIAALASKYEASAAAIKAGTNAGAATGPLAPFTTPAFIAGMLSLVITSFARIKQNNTIMAVPLSSINPV